MTDFQDALSAARMLQTALYRENDRLHGDAKLWPRATADALLQAKTYSHRVRRFLGVDAIAEARKAFDAIRWDILGEVVAGNADLRSAYETLREALARP